MFFPVVFVILFECEMPVRARSKMQEGDGERNTDVHKGVLVAYPIDRSEGLVVRGRKGRSAKGHCVT